MKCLGLFLLLVGPLFSQAEIQGPPRLVKYEANTIVVSTGQSYDGEALVDFVNYDYTITAAPNGDKTFTFSATRCSEFVSYDSLHQILIAVGEQNAPEGTHYTCTDLPYLDAISLAPVAAGLTLFYNLAPGMVAHNIVFKYSLPETNPPEQLSPRLTTVQPASPTNAQMILYDGLTNNIVDVDVTAGEILSQVTIPLASNVSIFGIRPTLTGAPTEVWAVSPPTGIFVVDESSASIAATIPVSIPPSSTPAGIVFSNDGSTAYEAVGYQSPDASGSKGELLILDAAQRIILSTLPLKVSPSAILMAPDGLTAYLLDNAGGITYYDILSGTADLSLSTFTPGLAGGYGPGNQVFIHPDGTRLFWNNGLSLVTFDLTLHKITQIFPSGLPPGTTASLRMSQEGSTVRFVNANGSTAVVDTRYGVVLETLQAQPGSITYPGPAN